MGFVYNLFDGGKKPKLRRGLVSVNSLNVYPTTVVATAAGTALGIELLDNYEFFNVAQTSAGTDYTLLPNAPVGTLVVIYAVSAVRVKAGPNASGRAINAGADTTFVSIPAGSTAVLNRRTLANWTCTLQTAAGVISTPTPA